MSLYNVSKVAHLMLTGVDVYRRLRKFDLTADDTGYTVCVLMWESVRASIESRVMPVECMCILPIITKATTKMHSLDRLWLKSQGNTIVFP